MAAESPLRQMTTTGLVAGAAFAAALALSGCARGGAESPPEAGDQAIAKVDGRTVWLSDVRNEAQAQGLIPKGAGLDPNAEVFRATLDQLVDRKLLAAEAVKRGLDHDAATERRLAAARERVLGDRLVEAVVAGAVSETAVQGLYKEQVKAAQRAEQIRARQIVTATEPEARAAMKLLAAGGAFEKLALQRSTDAATRFSGGDLGYFTPDVMPPGYATALAGARPGQTVGPFETHGGWAIIRVEDRRLEPPIPLAAARPQLVRFLTYDRIRDLLETLRSKAKVETLAKPAAGASPTPSTPAPEGRS
ncbi:peptidylprolyl isomerase [Phenylobacterium sp. LjRoot225]|uniref:peptidylprolyl isomerase n=1 Tax=Phenylobacterium sp. LjRoot225 TaxID=3342285 RepID=UPI003F50C94F